MAAGLLIILVGSAFWAGQRFRTPDQAAADAAPPSHSLITAPVERRSLSESLVLRARVVPGPSVALTVPAPVVGPDSVVTAVRLRTGDRVWDGTVLLVCSGQPMIAMALPFPLYRDLVGGMDGPDVTEVQRILRRLGYNTDQGGVLTTQTQAALLAMYKARGFQPPAGDPGAAEQLPGLEATLAQAEQELAALLADGADPDGEEATAAQQQVNEARSARDRAALRAGPGLPRSHVIRIDRTGRTVTSVNIAVGDVLSDPARVLVELDGAQPYLQAYGSREQADLLQPGQAAVLTDEMSGTTMAAVVATVGTEPATDDQTGESGYPITLTFVDAPPASAAGRGLRVEIEQASGEEVLAVPWTAIYSRPDGTTYVIVSRGGQTAEVVVTTGRSGGGWVELVSAEPEQVAPGDLVVVGVVGLNQPGA